MRTRSSRENIRYTSYTIGLDWSTFGFTSKDQRIRWTFLFHACVAKITSVTLERPHKIATNTNMRHSPSRIAVPAQYTSKIPKRTQMHVLIVIAVPHIISPLWQVIVLCQGAPIAPFGILFGRVKADVRASLFRRRRSDKIRILSILISLLVSRRSSVVERTFHKR